MKKFEKINYRKLNSRQKENYNYQKISSILADYGYSTIRLSDDWQSADFIAQHYKDRVFLKVQLKGRLGIDKKYMEKGIWICFRAKNKKYFYLYPHDEMANYILENSNVSNTTSWRIKGRYNWPQIPRHFLKFLDLYRLD